MNVRFILWMTANTLEFEFEKFEYEKTVVLFERRDFLQMEDIFNDFSRYFQDFSDFRQFLLKF